MFDSLKNRKEYLEGLMKAVVRIPPDFPLFDNMESQGFPKMDTLPNVRFTSITFSEHENLVFLKDVLEGVLLYRRVYYPLRNFYQYVYNNRIIKHLITELLNRKEKEYKPPFSPRKIYEALAQLDKHTADCIIGIMSGSSSRRLEKLRRAFFQDGNEHEFVKALEEDDYDAVKGSKLLRYCELNEIDDADVDYMFELIQSGKNISYDEKIEKELEQYRPMLLGLLEFMKDLDNGEWETKQYSIDGKKYHKLIASSCDEKVEKILSIKTPLLPEEKELFKRIVRCSIYEKRYEEIKSKMEHNTNSSITSYGKTDTQTEPLIKDPQKNAVRSIKDLTSTDIETENFKDAAPEEKAKELYNVIEELLNEIEVREHEFLSNDCVLNDLKNVFRDMLILDAGENINTQRAIIDELSGTDNNRITPEYHYKGRLWLQPFFIIIGHLYKKGVLKGDQRKFVKALFPDKQDKDPVYGVVNKEDFDFIDACRSKISMGKSNPPKEWPKWFEWLDTLL